MAEPVPPRKKIGVAAPISPTAQVKRGVRKRGGAPVEFRKPPPGSVAPPSADRGRPPREGDSRPPRSGGGFDKDRAPRPYPPRNGDPRAPRDRNPFAQEERASRPYTPRPDGDTRPPREGDSRPPRTGGGFNKDRPPRPYTPREGDTRPPRTGGGYSNDRPPREDRGFDRDRAPRPYTPREGDTRPPRDERPFNKDRAPRPYTPREGDTRPPRDDRGFSQDRAPRPYTPREGDTRPPRDDRGFKKDRPPRPTTPGTDDTRPPRAPRGDPRERRSFDDARSPRKFEPRGAAPLHVTNAEPRSIKIDTQGVQTFFATCPRGLEQLLREELLAIGAAGIEVSPGGALFKGRFTLGYVANLESRVASRIMWKMVEGDYRDEHDIYSLATSVDWPAAFPVEQTIKVQVTSIFSPLKSIDFIALKVKDAICDTFREAVGSRPSVDTSMPNQRIHVFLERSHCTIYLDLSGEALFKRGYRRDGLVAPIRENLAAGILRLLEWTPEVPLLDPMCGSGTFITEALLIAMNAAPGLRRRNAFERWSVHALDEYEAMKDTARARIALPPTLRLFARDASAEAIAQTRAHVASLGGTAAVNFEVCNALDLTPPCESGMMVANPPYGVRLGSSTELAQMYPQFGTLLKQRFAGWEASFITADLEMPGGIGLKATRRTPLRNGALDCRLFSFPLIEGSVRQS